MWTTDTHWFDVALMTGLLALGSIMFGRFEEHKPRWRRLLKAGLGVVLIVSVSAFAGRAWAFALILLIGAVVVVIHGWWLPRNGVNGWTAEPRGRYYALLGLDSTGRPRDRSD
jgi:hypothetical protein